MIREEELRDAQAAQEPGQKWDTVISEGDDDWKGTMTGTALTSAGYTYIYDTVTSERSLCNNNTLAQHLKKKRPDGSFVFTTRRPATPPKRGALKCLLHPDSPNRDQYDELGLPTCRKSNLTSPYQVTRHMQKRHKMEWATIEQERINQEKEEEREFKRLLVSQAQPPVYVSEKKKK